MNEVDKGRDECKTLQENNKGLAMNLQKWNKNIFGNIFQNKERLIRRIASIRRCLDTRYDRALIKLDKKLRKELDSVLHQEEFVLVSII